MKAILLAAGIGKRLLPYTEARPKCLIEIGGRSLLARHLDTLSTFDEIDGIVIVVGYRHDQIRDAVTEWKSDDTTGLEVTFATNERYAQGSILSLYASRDTLSAHDSVIMDADVLYHRDVMKRLVESPSEHCFLIDDQAEESGEEMMVCIRDGRAMHIARSHHPSTQTGWDAKGEGVGFFKLAHKDSGDLLSVIEELLGQGLEKSDYEDALAGFMKKHPCGYVGIGDLPWTEIDFSEDIVAAENEVLPKILQASSAPK
jgi:choline kinase